MRHSCELGECGLHRQLVEADESTLVPHLVAVVGRAEHRYALPVVVCCWVNDKKKISASVGEERISVPAR